MRISSKPPRSPFQSGLRREHEHLLRPPFLDHIGAGGRWRCGREPAAGPLEGFAAHDAARSRGQRAGPERRERLLQDDHAGVTAGHFDLIERGEVVPVLRLLRRIGDPLVAELDVVGGHLAEAAREQDARPEREADPGAVKLLDRCRGRRSPVPFVAGPVLDQPGEEAAQDVALGLALPVRRIEHLKVGRGAYPEHVHVLGMPDAGPHHRGRPEQAGPVQQTTSRELLHR